MHKRTFLKLGGLAGLGALGTAGAMAAPAARAAQPPGDYPNRAIRMVSPFAAGSTSDTSARFVAHQMELALKQPVTVDNLPGADGRIGITNAKNAPADGYTLVMGSWTNLAVNPVLIKGLPYDALKDFKPVAGIGRSMLGIVVSAQSPIRSLADLIAAAKARPRSLNFGNFATGYRLATEWLSSLAGVEFTHVNYKSTSQMNTDIVAAQIDAGMDGVTSLAPLIRGGKLRLIAVTGEARHPEFKDVPTVRETFSDYAIYGWSALMARSEVPDAIVAHLSQVVNQAMASPEGKAFAEKVGSELLLRGPKEMRQFQAEQIALLRRVAEAAGMKPE